MFSARAFFGARKKSSPLAPEWVAGAKGLGCGARRRRRLPQRRGSMLRSFAFALEPLNGQVVHDG